MSTQPFGIERLFNSPVSEVWSALTDREQMKQWYFNLPDFKPEVGFEFRFLAGESEDKQYCIFVK